MKGALPPEFLAVLASACFAASHVTLRKGIVQTSIISSVLVGQISAASIVGLAVMVGPAPEIRMQEVILFALGGLAAQGLSLWATTVSVRKLGPSISAPITQSTRVLISVVGAIAFLHEVLSLQKAVGLAAIMVGGWRLSRIKDVAGVPVGGPTGTEPPGRPALFRPGIVFPLLAGASYATGDIIFKDALAGTDDARAGALIALTAALAASSSIAISVPSVRRSWRLAKDSSWVALSGALAGTAMLSLFNAFESGDVSIVIPILASQPLMVFFLSRLMLRKMEDLHLSTVLAGCSVVVGTIIISL